ncbi:MAG: hypothetical protein H6R19_2631 [Proteobacteria bacterium]|nr:hypothetical protein [Pseudomonadota bacterium]
MTGSSVRQAQRLNGVGAGLRCDRGNINATQLGQHPGELRNIGGLIASLCRPGRRDIRCIGFKDDGTEWQTRRKRPDTRRAGIGHCATKAQFETPVNEGLRLLHAAIEGMCDAAPYRMAPQVFEHPVLGTPGMEDHGQIELTGQLQLLDEKPILVSRISFFLIRIQSDLPHRPRSPFGKQTAQTLDIRFLCPVDIQRVDPESMRTTRMLIRQLAYRSTIGNFHRRQHKTGYPDVLCRIDDRSTIRVEFNGIQMEVSVNEHGGSLLHAEALDIPADPGNSLISQFNNRLAQTDGFIGRIDTRHRNPDVDNALEDRILAIQ